MQIDYKLKLVMQRKNLILGLAYAASMQCFQIQAADVREGLISYWPLDTVANDLSNTPDRVTGNHFLLGNVYDNSLLVDGKRGKAISLDGDISQKYLYFKSTPERDSGLPISMKRAYTITFWVKGKGTGQNDRRIFCESSSTNTDPLMDLGTHNAGTDDTLDIFVRNSGTQINHVHTPTAALDDQWHYIAWTETAGDIKLYIDGKLDYTNRITRGPTVYDTTTLGVVLRESNGTPLQYFFTGLIDEVAVWERMLGADEILEVMNSGIQLPVPSFAPSITIQPTGATNLIVGDAFVFSAGAMGTRPLTYEWRKNSTPIPGANSPTLSLTNLSLSDSGDYTLVVRNSANSATSATAKLLVSPIPGPNLTNGMVAYWPLNEVQGTKTPELANGYDMELENLSSADLKPGKWGQAMAFDNGRKTLLKRIDNPGEDLPIYQHPDFSVSLWVNGAPQSDRRVFSEGSTKSTQPLFNIGTHNAGTDGTVDSYIRTDAGATSGDHRHSVAVAFDETWHHICYVQRNMAGVMQAVLYVDGVKDDMVLGPVRPLTLNTTTIGGILRASASAWFTGLIDDVAVWKRALSEEEIKLLFTKGTPAPPSKSLPLAIAYFKSDLPAVVKGDSIILRWDASKDTSSLEISPDVGDVTTKTVAGAGSITVPLTESKTFTLTIKRGAETLSASTTVSVIDGVNPNWTLLDNFDRYPTGLLADTPYWQDLRGQLSQIVDLNGNRMLSVLGSDNAAVLRLQSLTLKEGQQATLFFRVVCRGNPAAAVSQIVGLTDKNVRWFGDANGNAGPTLYPTYDTTLLGWQFGVRNGAGAAVEFAPNAVATNIVYSVWLNVKNERMIDPVSPTDLYSVYIQKDGDTARTELFKDYLSDRDPTSVDPVIGGMGPDLDKLVIACNNATDSPLYDDFYLSKTGYNNSLPRPFGFTTPFGGEPSKPTVVSISRSGAQLEISWPEGTLESAPAINGPWMTVQGAASPAYKLSPAGSQMFFRVRK